MDVLSFFPRISLSLKKRLTPILKWRPGIVVFLAAVFLMTVELTASRLVAPYLGNSLYTWTIIIGVILAGVSLGNYWGGKLIDRKTDFCFLSDVLIVSSVLVFLIIFLKPFLAYSSFFRWFFPLRVLFCVSLLFLAPAVGLGMVLPAVTRLRLETIKTGRGSRRDICPFFFGKYFWYFFDRIFSYSLFGEYQDNSYLQLGIARVGMVGFQKKDLIVVDPFFINGVLFFFALVGKG